MSKYQEIIKLQAPLKQCFFAFSKEQIKEGIQNLGLKNMKIISAGAGLYGTMEGIIEYTEFYDKIKLRISKECKPQDVYNYEYLNHECEYTGDDTEAFEIVQYYFTFRECQLVKRKLIPQVF